MVALDDNLYGIPEFTSIFYFLLRSPYKLPYPLVFIASVNRFSAKAKAARRKVMCFS